MSATLDRLSPADPAAPATRHAGPAILTAETVEGPAWDAIAAGFDEVCQEQLFAFAANRWPGAGSEAVVFRREGEIVGGTLMMIQRLPLGVGTIAVSKWGPMLARAGAPDAETLYGEMIESLIERYARRRSMMLSVLPRAMIGDANARYGQLMARGFRRGSELRFPNRYIVDLGLDAASQRKSLNQKWRYHLNKSEKNGLAFEVLPSDELGAFHELYAAMTDRKQFSDHSAYETIDALSRMEPQSLRPASFLVRHEGQAVAGAIVFTAGERAVYLYGATNAQALPLRAGYFMHWHIIEWLRANTRARWYDLGGTDGYQGLHQFKKGMVGEAGVIVPVPPVANFATNPLAYAVGAGAFAARDVYYAARRRFDAWRNPAAAPDQARPDARGTTP